MKYAHMQLATSWPEHLINGLEILAVTFIILCIISLVGYGVTQAFEKWPVGFMIFVSIIIFIVIVFKVL